MDKIYSMLSRVFSILMLACFVSSCVEKFSQSGIEKMLINQSPQSLSLPLDTLPIDLLAPTDLVAVDTFLLVLQHHEEKIIHVYSAHSYECLGSFLRRGGGPNEVQAFGIINQSFMEDGLPKILIQSYPNYLGVLNIRRSLDEGETVYDRVYKFETDNARRLFMASDAVYLLSNTQLLMMKEPLRSGITEHANFSFDFYDYEADELFRPNLLYEDFPLMDAFLKESAPALKPDGTKMALFYRFFDMVSIVDLQTGVVKQVVTDLGKYGVSRVMDVDTRKLYYKAGECSDSYLFGLYMNGFPVTEVDSPESSWTSVLRLFDWDGQLRYESDLGAKIRLIAVDDKQQYLYGVTEDDAIVRYDLSVLSE